MIMDFITLLCYNGASDFIQLKAKEVSDHAKRKCGKVLMGNDRFV